MHSRDHSLESLLDISGRPGSRSRPDAVSRALGCVIELGDAAGACATWTEGRRAAGAALRRGASTEPFAPARGGSDLGRLLRTGRPITTPDLSTDPRLALEDACPGVVSGPALFVPLRLREQEPGFLAAYRRTGAPPFDREAVRRVMLLAAWTAMALDNHKLAERVEKLAVTDDLTQVYNYRFLKTALRRELKRAARFRQNLSLIMIDVDNLKSYNDRHGHLRGSFLLREIARLLALQVRSWDLVSKYGGDEFTIILPQTAGDGAEAVAERLRVAVEQHAFPLAERGQITISLGIACFPGDAVSPSQLIAIADRALYQAKREGRNRTQGVESRAA